MSFRRRENKMNNDRVVLIIAEIKEARAHIDTGYGCISRAEAYASGAHLVMLKMSLKSIHLVMDHLYAILTNIREEKDED